MSERLWEFKYATKEWDNFIINEEIKPTLKKNLDERPNMLLFGPPGVGKGTYVDILIAHNKLENCNLKINASLEGGIDTIRDKVAMFAQALGFENKMKLVYLNEADHPNLQAAQKSLRQLIEDTQKLTQWILVCNYQQVIIPELKSRTQAIHICNPPAKEIFLKCEHILKNENVKYQKRTLLDLVKKCYPDIRNTIITLRENTIDGKLKEKITFSSVDKLFDEIIVAIKSKDPDEIRKILRSNSIYYPQLYEFLYGKIMDNEDDVFKNDVEMLLLVGEHSYRNEIVSIPEVNFMTFIFKALQNGYI